MAEDIYLADTTVYVGVSCVWSLVRPLHLGVKHCFTQSLASATLANQSGQRLSQRLR